MKNSIVYCLTIILTAGSVHAQKGELTKVWETDANLRVPESVILDKDRNVLFFSDIEGEPNAKDGKGSIGKMDVNGKVLNIDWLTGLNAPKGLAIFNNKLYVADVDEVVVIDIKSAKVLEHISVFDSKFLNDISIDKNGILYVTDTERGNIHRIETSNNNALSTFLTGLKSVNGVLIIGEDIYFLSAGTLWKSDKNKVVTKIAESMDESTDGLEQTKTGNFIVSCWTGIIYEVKPNGGKIVLLDTRQQKLNTADIGFDAEKNMIYVPTFFGNKIVAYKLK